VPGAQLVPAELTDKKDVHSKYICFQAPLLNRGTIWLGDSKNAVSAKEGIVFRPGEKIVMDIDSDRALGMYLADFVFAGDYGGDQLVVAYLEEQNNGEN
jgi:hypothetical protein